TLKSVRIRVPPWAKKSRRHFLSQLRNHRRVKLAKTIQGISIMDKKLIVTTLAVLAFAFGITPRSSAGTDMVEPYSAPARTYNYGPPPPRPVVYAPPVRFGVFFGPGCGWGPRVAFSRRRRI